MCALLFCIAAGLFVSWLNSYIANCIEIIASGARIFADFFFQPNVRSCWVVDRCLWCMDHVLQAHMVMEGEELERSLCPANHYVLVI